MQRAGDPYPEERVRNLAVSSTFARKIQRIAEESNDTVESVFERALALAIADHHAKCTAMARTYPALPLHHHTVIFDGVESIYYFGRIGLAVNHRCNLIAVGIAPVSGDD
jgi:hypothetical protein